MEVPKVRAANALKVRPDTRFDGERFLAFPKPTYVLHELLLFASAPLLEKVNHVRDIIGVRRLRSEHRRRYGVVVSPILPDVDISDYRWPNLFKTCSHDSPRADDVSH